MKIRFFLIAIVGFCVIAGSSSAQTTIPDNQTPSVTKTVHTRVVPVSKEVVQAPVVKPSQSTNYVQRAHFHGQPAVADNSKIALKPVQITNSTKQAAPHPLLHVKPISDDKASNTTSPIK